MILWSQAFRNHAKEIKQFYYDKTMVNFCKGCDVHVFFVEEFIEAVVIYSKKVAKK